jgi:serine/threonine protein kinase
LRNDSVSLHIGTVLRVTPPSSTNRSADKKPGAFVLQWRCFKEDIARYFFQQLVCGLEWCHSQVWTAVVGVRLRAQLLRAVTSFDC